MTGPFDFATCIAHSMGEAETDAAGLARFYREEARIYVTLYRIAREHGNLDGMAEDDEGRLLLNIAAKLEAANDLDALAANEAPKGGA